MRRDDPPSAARPISLDAPIAAIMRAQAPVAGCGRDPIDDDTVLTLLELASHATAGSRRRCEFVVVRDPDVRHQLARTYRQGWSIYRRVLRTRSRRRRAARGPAVGGRPLRGRPGDRRGLRPRPPAGLPGRSARPSFYASALPGGAEPPARAPAPSASAAPATTLPLWSALGGPPHPRAARDRSRRSRSSRSGWPRGRRPPRRPSPPVGNLVHLDRYGHQPFRAALGTERIRRGAPGHAA